MEAAVLLFAFLIYILFVWILSSAVKSETGRKPFWWIFFLGIVGAVIVVLLDIRDSASRISLRE